MTNPDREDAIYPVAERCGEVRKFLVARERRGCAAAAPGAVAHDVPAVSAPLAGCFVARVNHSDSTTLVEPLSRSSGSASGYPSTFLA